MDFFPKYGVSVPPPGFASLLIFLVVAGWTVFRYPLVELSARFAAWPVLETLADPLLVLDREGRIRLANPAVRELLGHDPEELRGKAVEVLEPEKSKESGGSGESGGSKAPPHREREGLPRLLEEPGLRDREVAVRCAEGEEVEMSLSTSALEGR